MIGLSKSESRKPTARSMARFGARSTPCVIALLLLFRVTEILPGGGQSADFSSAAGRRDSIEPFLQTQRASSKSMRLFRPFLRRSANYLALAVAGAGVDSADAVSFAGTVTGSRNF